MYNEKKQLKSCFGDRNLLTLSSPEGLGSFMMATLIAHFQYGNSLVKEYYLSL